MRSVIAREQGDLGWLSEGGQKLSDPGVEIWGIRVPESFNQGEVDV